MTYIVVSGVTRDKFEAAKAELAEAGLPITTDIGAAKIKGFQFTWEYNRAGETLQVNLVGKPWYVPEATIVDRVTKELAARGFDQVLVMR